MFHEWFGNIIYVTSLIIISYIILLCLFYLVILVIAAKYIRDDYRLNLKEAYSDLLQQTESAPPLSVLVPAYNEEVGIVSTISSLMKLQYPAFEMIVINDGSKDQTLQEVLHKYEMKQVHTIFRQQLKNQPIRAIYQSKLYSNLYVIDKENGGKADALNAGINFSHFPYFCSIDGDTILEKDALLKIMKPIVDSKKEIIAVGGSVRIANGCKIENGEVKKIGLPKNPLVVMQVIEYFRAFLVGRFSLSKFNLLPIISGAFSVFSKKWVLEVGGYSEKTVGEDMEIILKLHRHRIEQKKSAEIIYIPQSVCWTEAPNSLRILRNQRTRWHRGLLESLWKHKDMIFNPKYKGIGWISMPYYLIVELFGPIIEFLGYVVIVLEAIRAGYLSDLVLLMFFLGLFYGSFLSVSSILLEEWGLQFYGRIRELTILFFYALFESFWYRPITLFWRFIGTFQALFGKQGWGEMKRQGVLK
ncbi:glycosyltransferase family 2 protein [Neobacillus sp. D3-1R]|uniref:glycosyltransferase family 2 protein n=1 Tax=Neobacillus sp. D3-1R TaxID=3445778 RepID=UPI003FA14A04